MECTGSCCAAFALNFMPHDTQEVRKNPDALAAGRGTTQEQRERRDIAYIADMAIPLSLEEAARRAERFGGTGPQEEERFVWYTCRHWDETTRLCTSYEERPDLCSHYPYDQECNLAATCGFVSSADIALRYAVMKRTVRLEGFEAAWYQGLERDDKRAARILCCPES